MFLELILFGILLFIFFSYKYIKLNNYEYWKRKNIEGPKPHTLYGNTPNLFKRKINFIYNIDNIYHEYKGKAKCVGVFFLQTPKLLITEKNLIREILTKNFDKFPDNETSRFVTGKEKLLFNNPHTLTGKNWKISREKLSVVLNAEKLYPFMMSVSKQLSDYIGRESKRSLETGIEVTDLGYKYVAQVTSNCVYGVDIFAFSKIFRLVHMDNVVPDKYTLKSPLQLILPNFWKKFIINDYIEEFFINTMRSAVDFRLEMKIDRKDILQDLIKLKHEKNISNVELASYGVPFYTEGFYAIANLFANILFMLGKYHNVQDKLRNEISTSMEEKEEISLKKLQDLPYLDQIVYETLRLFPFSMMLSKICTKSHQFEDFSGKMVSIDVGEIVEIPIFSIHRDEEFYSDPNEFNPDRFNSEHGGVQRFKDIGVFLPFSEGSRMCPGMQYGLVQTKVAIFDIIRDYKVNLNSKMKSDFKLCPNQLNCMMDGGVWINFNKISHLNP